MKGLLYSALPYLLVTYLSVTGGNVGATCVTTRHVSGYGNRGGGFISNDHDVDNLYLNNERCGWEVAVPQGATITFHFIQLALESPGGECFDWVAIHDGRDQTAPLLVKQCVGGRQLLRRTFHTSQHYGFVYFYSDGSRRSEGFRLRWTRQAPKPQQIEISAEREPPALAPCSDTRFISGLGLDQNSGYITNDKDPESLYFNGESCGWLISVPGDSTIRFFFTKIDLETVDDNASGEACKFDWVSIYDGLRATSPLITKQCSSGGLGKSFFTTQQYAFVQFHTDQSVQYEGFELRWLRQGPKSLPSLRPPARNYSAFCAATRFVADQGDHGGYIANDMAADGLYLNNEHCSWQIHVAEPLTIWLYFTEIELETSDSGECFDWVGIYDGPDRNASLLTKQCSTSALGLNFHTTQEYAYVFFHSDNSQRYKGFKLHWLPQDNAPKVRSDPLTTPPPADDCMELVEIRANDTMTSGTIENLREPNTGLYRNNQRCTWRVTVQDGAVIVFKFTKVDLEHHESCWHDWVSILDGESKHSRTLTKQCSLRALGKNFTTSGNVALIQFRTDSSGRRSGFRLQWNQIVQTKPSTTTMTSKTTTGTTLEPNKVNLSTKPGADSRFKSGRLANSTSTSVKTSSPSTVTKTRTTSTTLTSRSATNRSKTASTTLLTTKPTMTMKLTPKVAPVSAVGPTVPIDDEVSSIEENEEEEKASSDVVEQKPTEKVEPEARVLEPGLVAGIVVIGIISCLIIFASGAFLIHYRNEHRSNVFYLNKPPRQQDDGEEQHYQVLPLQASPQPQVLPGLPAATILTPAENEPPILEASVDESNKIDSP